VVAVRVTVLVTATTTSAQELLLWHRDVVRTGRASNGSPPSSGRAAGSWTGEDRRDPGGSAAVGFQAFYQATAQRIFRAASRVTGGDPYLAHHVSGTPTWCRASEHRRRITSRDRLTVTKSPEAFGPATG
jgi:hypothetical protein